MRNMELESKLPYWKIVRHPEKHKVPIKAFWQNSLEATEILRKILTRQDDLSDLLSSRKRFRSLILNLHCVMCRNYSGRGNVKFTASDIGRIRTIDAISTKVYMNFITQPQTSHAHVAQYIEFNRNFYSAEFEKYPRAKLEVIDKRILRAHFISCAQIEESLCYMRRILRAILCSTHASGLCTNREREIYILSGLALFSQVAIHSQAVLGVWNSIISGVICNTILEFFELDAMPARNRDSASLIMADDAYIRYYIFSYYREKLLRNETMGYQYPQSENSEDGPDFSSIEEDSYQKVKQLLADAIKYQI